MNTSSAMILKKAEKPLVKPFKEQTACAKAIVGNRKVAVIAKPGAGKTIATLLAICELLEKGDIDNVLLIAPLSVMTVVWPEEISKWEQFSHLKFSVIHGTDREKQKALDAEAHIYLINPDFAPLTWLGAAGRWHKFKSSMLVVDEVTKFKNYKSLRFREVSKVSPYFKYVVTLTGSPTANGYLGLWAMHYLVDRGVALGTKFWEFARTFFHKGGFKAREWVPNDDCWVQIRARIKKSVHFMPVPVELPALVMRNLPVLLPPKVRKIYDQVENELVHIIEQSEKNMKAVRAGATGSAYDKLRQIASGAVITTAVDLEDGSVYNGPVEILHTAKIEALQELAEQVGESSILVGYFYSSSLAQLRKAFKNAPFICGGVSVKDRQAAITQFNAGLAPVMLVQLTAGSHGLNLQHSGNHVVIYDPTSDAEVQEQFCARVWRQGQKADTVFVHRIMAKDTVDEDIVESQDAKATGQKADILSLMRNRAASHTKSK